jgi:hypothetical protein
VRHGLVEVKNRAEPQVYQAKKLVEEHGDKLSAGGGDKQAGGGGHGPGGPAHDNAAKLVLFVRARHRVSASGPRLRSTRLSTLCVAAAGEDPVSAGVLRSGWGKDGTPIRAIAQDVSR